MKKLISLLLCTILVLGVFSGCSGSSLKVGYAYFDITPTENMRVTLGGDLTGTRDVQVVYDRLPGMCLAFTDSDDNTILMYSLDLLYATGTLMGFIRAISKATGVPENQILISTTHCHSAPHPDTSVHKTNAAYMDMVKQLMIKAGNDALADRKEAKMHTASVELEKMNSVRHYLLVDGTVAGDNFGSQTTPIERPVSEVDKEMQLIKFTRTGGEDILLMNWQGHPKRNGTGITTQSATISGLERMRVQLKEEHNTLLAFFLGASGNVNNQSRISKDMKFVNYQEHYQYLAQQAISQQFKQVKTGKLVLKSNVVGAAGKGTNKISVNIYALSLGDVAFVFAPYEMFNSSGLAIKAGSPYDTTFVSTCAMGSVGYIPDEATFEYGGYEVNGSQFGKGACETLTEGFISLLKDLK